MTTPIPAPYHPENVPADWDADRTAAETAKAWNAINDGLATALAPVIVRLATERAASEKDEAA